MMRIRAPPNASVLVVTAALLRNWHKPPAPQAADD
jgi:hypothetical protein